MGYTAIGSIAVLLWGAALPVMRLVESSFGLLWFVVLTFGIAGGVGLARECLSGARIQAKVLSSKWLWVRWFFFVSHEIAVNIAITQVSTLNVPFVVLLNYFWPTAVLLASTMFAGVRIYRPASFAFGTLIVLGSLSAEIAAPTFMQASFSAHDLLQFGIVFFGAVSWGIYSAITRRFGGVSGGSSVLPFFQLSISLLLPFVLWTATSHEFEVLPLALGDWTLLIGLSLSQVVGYLCWEVGVSRGNIVILSLLADFIPWLSLLSCALILDSHIGWGTVVSAIALVIGAIVTRYGTIRGSSSQTPRAD